MRHIVEVTPEGARCSCGREWSAATPTPVMLRALRGAAKRHEHAGNRRDEMERAAGQVDAPARASGCECCDHPLEHAIREVLDIFEHAVPPLKPRTVLEALRERLYEWKYAREVEAEEQRAAEMASRVDAASDWARDEALGDLN